MADLDAVAIATPVKTHHPIAKEFLSHGKHVFIEKPLTHSYETALELTKLAEEKQKVLMVGHTFEYTAAVNKVKEIIASGELGKILYISCTRVNLGLFQPDINVIWDLAPHDISIILYLMGEVPVSVNSQGKAHFNHEIEDVATTTLNFKNGLIAFIHNSWLDPNKIRRTTIVGSRKMLVYDDIETQEKIKIYDKGVDVPPYYDTFADFQYSYRYGDIHSPRIDDFEPLKKVCDHFVECIKKGRSPLSDGYSGLRVVSILEAASKSLQQNGKAISLQGFKTLQRKSNSNGNGHSTVNAWR
jgi:predicted dehydrogenase